MKTISRAGGAVAALAVGAALALTPQSAQAATSPQAEDATSWLASQLPDDNIVKNDIYPDFGLTIDFALAFLGTGTESASATKILDALASDPETFTQYTTGEDFIEFGEIEGSQYAGATGKLATLVQLGERVPTSFGGHNLIEETEKVVVDEGSSKGRAKDITSPTFGDNSNSIGQAFVVRALSTAKSPEADAAAAYLVKQQCDSGVFRINMSDAGCGTAGSGDTTSIDTTAFAIEALAVNGDARYDAAIAKAAAFLVGAQEDDGSFTDTGADNSNSTGLAAAALNAAGEGAAATKAADFVASLQLPASAGDDAGAIAYDQVAYDAAKTTGVPDNLDDQFNRATAQAALGLLYATAPVDPGPGTDPDPEVGPVEKIELKVSDSTPTQGDTITVTTTGQDADGDSAGDVSDDVTLKSSVDTDTVEGNKVTFNHASPHSITATYTDPDDATNVRTASVVVEVAPAAAAVDPVSGAAPSAVANGSLPDTGSTVQPWLLGLAAAMIVAGTALVTVRRRSSDVTAADR